MIGKMIVSQKMNDYSDSELEGLVINRPKTMSRVRCRVDTFEPIKEGSQEERKNDKSRQNRIKAHRKRIQQDLKKC